MDDNRRPTRLAVLGLVALIALACGPASSPSPTVLPTQSPTGSVQSSSSAGPTSVNVTLLEFAIGATPHSVPAGDVRFVVTNNGPEDIHEFVVIKTDLDATQLPTDANGLVDEEGAGIEVTDEIEDMAVGDTEELNVSLDAGNYVLICNIYDESEQKAHYQEGMRVPFTVE